MVETETSIERKSLRDWLHLKMNDNQRFLLVCILCGLLCGVAAVVLHWSIHHLFDLLWNWASQMETWKFVGLMLAAPTLAGLLVGVLATQFCPAAIGSGIPQTKVAYFNYGGKVRLMTGAWRYLLTTIYCGLGNSLGREGPTIHLASAISSRLGRWMFKNPGRIQSVTPVGMAAGIAAAFNAPLSAITFVFEELLDNFSMKSLGGIVIAVVTAAAVSRSLLGEDPILSSDLDLQFETSAWMFVAIPLGVIAGLMGHVFVGSVLKLRGRFNCMSPMARRLNPAVGGFSCGILGLGAFYITTQMGEPQHSVFSVGYESLELAFEANIAVQVVAVLLVFKFIAVVLNYATGGSGGLFSPTLFLGGMMGCLIGFGLVFFHENVFEIAGFPSHSKVIGGCVLLGMGAMFSSVVRCPFTSLIIIFEMTGNYSLILPLMAGNMLSWSLARKWRTIALYDSLLLQDGVNLRKFPAYQGAKDYRSLPVSAIMTYEPFILDGRESVAANLGEIHYKGLLYHGFPVQNGEEELLGVVTHHELEDAEAGVALHTLVDDQDVISVTPETSIRDAANRMINSDIQQVPVVLPNNPRKLIGLLTLNDIARQQNVME